MLISFRNTLTGHAQNNVYYLGIMWPSQDDKGNEPYYQLTFSSVQNTLLASIPSGIRAHAYGAPRCAPWLPLGSLCVTSVSHCPSPCSKAFLCTCTFFPLQVTQGLFPHLQALTKVTYSGSLTLTLQFDVSASLKSPSLSSPLGFLLSIYHHFMFFKLCLSVYPKDNAGASMTAQAWPLPTVKLPSFKEEVQAGWH